MGLYKKYTGRNGTRYMKNGRIISVRDIPPNIVQVLENNLIFDEDKPPTQRDHECIFCGQYAKYERSVNLQTVEICEEHYYSMNVGKIAEKIREKQDA